LLEEKEEKEEKKERERDYRDFKITGLKKEKIPVIL